MLSLINDLQLIHVGYVSENFEESKKEGFLPSEACRYNGCSFVTGGSCSAFYCPSYRRQELFRKFESSRRSLPCLSGFQAALSRGNFGDFDLCQTVEKRPKYSDFDSGLPWDSYAAEHFFDGVEPVQLVLPYEVSSSANN